METLNAERLVLNSAPCRLYRSVALVIDKVPTLQFVRADLGYPGMSVVLPKVLANGLRQP